MKSERGIDMLYGNSEFNNFSNYKNLSVKNKKFIYIGLVVIIFIIVMAFCIFHFTSKNNISKNTVLTATDNSFTIEIPGSISYGLGNDNNFVIDIFSKKDEMFIYCSRISKERMVDFYQIVQDDKERYMSEKQNIRDDSGIVQTKVHDYTAYEYSFVYYDSTYGKDFYNNILWIETEKNLYVLNFEVVNDNVEKYKDIFLNIKNSFIEL